MVVIMQMFPPIGILGSVFVRFSVLTYRFQVKEAERRVVRLLQLHQPLELNVIGQIVPIRSLFCKSSNIRVCKVFFWHHHSYSWRQTFFTECSSLFQVQGNFVSLATPNNSSGATSPSRRRPRSSCCSLDLPRPTPLKPLRPNASPIPGGTSNDGIPVAVESHTQERALLFPQVNLTLGGWAF